MRKADQSRIESVWERLQNGQDVDELLQQNYLLEFLWPKGDMSTASQINSVATLVQLGHRRNMELLKDLAASNEQKFVQLFDAAVENAHTTACLVDFLAVCFSRLDLPLVRKLVAPLVSIPIWININETRRDQLLSRYPQLQKQWKSYSKKFKKSDKETQDTIRKQQTWLANLVTANNGTDKVWVQSLVDFMVVLLGQIPTRRYTNTLFKELNVLERLARQPCESLKFYMNFPIDDFSGEALKHGKAYYQVSQDVKHFQQVVYSNFKDKLKTLALTNVGSVTGLLDSQLSALTLEELSQLAQLLGVSENHMNSVLKQRYQIPSRLVDYIDGLTNSPTESVLHFLPNPPLATTQHLSISDLLVKIYTSRRMAMFYNTRLHLTAVLDRVAPEPVSTTQKRKQDDLDVNVRFLGTSSKYAAKIRGDPAIVRIVHPAVGEKHPARVQVEASIEVSNDQWSISKGDVVYLMQIGENHRVEKLRTGNVTDYRAPLLMIDIDPSQFPPHEDPDNPELRIVQSMNIIVREGNPPQSKARATLQLLKQLISKFEHGYSLPEWLNDALIGLSVPSDDQAETEAVQRQDIQGLSAAQCDAASRASSSPLSVVHAPPFTGKSEVVSAFCGQFPQARTLVVTPGRCTTIASKIARHGVPELAIAVVEGSAAAHVSEKTGTLANAHQIRNKLLRKVDEMAASQGISGAHGDSCENARYFFNICGGDDDMVKQVDFLHPIEVLDPEQAQAYLLKMAKVVVMDAAVVSDNISDLDQYDNLVLVDAGQLDEVESVIPALSRTIQRVLLLGSAANSGWYKQLLRMKQGTPDVELSERFGVRPEILELAGVSVGAKNAPPEANAGFAFNVQSIAADDDEVEVQHGVFQSPTQAEYAVTLFKYMRLLEYPNDSIAIIVANIGQKILVQQLLDQDAHHSFFGTCKVSTLEEWRTGHCDYVIACTRANTAVSQLANIPTLGLYLLGQGTENLVVVTGELYSRGTRHSTGKATENAVEMHGLSHFSQYVDQMTSQRMRYEQIRNNDTSR